MTLTETLCKQESHDHEITESASRFSDELKTIALGALVSASMTKESTAKKQVLDLAAAIFSLILKNRRFSGNESDCASANCPKCRSHHFDKISEAVAANRPISFVLPAFPGKSPNPAKVFGPLPDRAEEEALSSLQKFCEKIKELYKPGALIILCSDGRVFSDVIGMQDTDVTKYQAEISDIIKRNNLNALRCFNLDELYSGLDFEAMRLRVMCKYGEPVEALKASVKRGSTNQGSVDDVEAHRLYRGITRFMFEDSLVPGLKKSRTSLQKESRSKAYLVIQRSKAWGELISEQFPDAVRLSIHPQSCGAKKIGIRLIEPDQWQTPWHGVAVKSNGKFVLMKRAQAEALGAILVTHEGRPSHFELATASCSAAELPNADFQDLEFSATVPSIFNASELKSSPGQNYES